VGQWEGGGTQTVTRSMTWPIRFAAGQYGKTMRFTGITILKVENGQITRRSGWTTVSPCCATGPDRAGVTID